MLRRRQVADEALVDRDRDDGHRAAQPHRRPRPVEQRRERAGEAAERGPHPDVRAALLGDRRAELGAGERRRDEEDDEQHDQPGERLPPPTAIAPIVSTTTIAEIRKKIVSSRPSSRRSFVLLGGREDSATCCSDCVMSPASATPSLCGDEPRRCRTASARPRRSGCSPWCRRRPVHPAVRRAQRGRQRVEPRTARAQRPVGHGLRVVEDPDVGDESVRSSRSSAHRARPRGLGGRSRAGRTVSAARAWRTVHDS